MAGHSVIHFLGPSSHLVLRRRAPGGALHRPVVGAGEAARVGAWRAPSGERRIACGADVILHDLSNGRDQLLGSVGEISFKEGDLLAYLRLTRRSVTATAFSCSTFARAA
jgi:hypothetical protein